MTKEAHDFVCPKCGTSNKASLKLWYNVGYVPIICVGCDELFWSRFVDQRETTVVDTAPRFEEQIPELVEGTPVFVVNKEHEKHLEPGYVAAREHAHYRIRFNDGNMIWMPQHWIEKIPW
jgi:hypothetical protein